MLWEQVKEMEENDEVEKLRGQLGEIKATIAVNYGKEGKCIAGIIDSDPWTNSQSLLQQLVTILNYYNNIKVKLETQNDKLWLALGKADEKLHYGTTTLDKEVHNLLHDALK